MHLESTNGQVEREAAHQPSQGLVRQPRKGHHQWRLRGELPSQATATFVSDAARQRVLRDLSLSRGAVADAAASDWHRSVQIRRVRAEPIDQSNAQSELLETATPVSRRCRLYDHPESVDRAIGIHCREPRHDLAI